MWTETPDRKFIPGLTKTPPSSVMVLYRAPATCGTPDHAIYAAAITLSGGTPEKTGFPFANDAAHLQGELGTWKFADVPGELHPLLMSFKPYLRE